jgi:stage V sporulation protein B
MGNETKAKSSTKLFFSGVALLTVSNLVIKAIGLMFKIPMNAIVGDEGMGYYGSAYTVYTLLYMIATAGLPVALSIMVSEARAKGRIRQVQRILKTAMTVFIIVGLVGMCVMIFGSKFISNLIGAPPTYMCLIAVAPTLFFICISSALRGYFQGYQQMVPTAVSQLIEALCKLIIGITFAKYAISQGYAIAMVAAYAALGLTIGAGLGMIFMVISKLVFKSEPYDAEYLADGEDTSVEGTGAILKRLFIIALPITLSASVMSLTNLIDTALVQNLLQKVGYSQELATTMYGNYTSLAVPMFNMPPVLIYPISYSIVPMLTAAINRGDNKRAKTIMNSCLRVSVLVGMPCGLGLAALAKPILSLFYKAESVEMAWPLLTLLGPSTMFLCILSISNSILQVNGYERKPLISMAIGACVKLVASFILVQTPGVEMKGTPISTFLCYLTVTAIDFYFLKKYIHMKLNFVDLFLRPFIASAACAAAALGSYTLISSYVSTKLATLLSICVAGVVYLVLIFVTKAIRSEDITMLPKGEKLLGILKKAKLVK